MKPEQPVTTQRPSAPQVHPSAHAPGTVVFYPCRADGDPNSHDSLTHMALAEKLAALRGDEFAGRFDHACNYAGPLYFVPSDTLVADVAQRLGIHGEQDLFGGVVPCLLDATKIITHPLLDESSHAPAGWARAFARHAQDAVLAGFSVFTLQDARDAGARLLKQGPVRIKKVSGTGGVGQEVAADAQQLEELIASIDAEELAHEGVVLEQNLKKVVTHSIGQVRVGELLATYCGMQRLTTNNRGTEVYGGSSLIVVRGDFDALLRLELAEAARTAIAQAGIYHRAARASFPGMFASRCNYDVAQGFDDNGNWHSGVLEQSWRIGGASGAEIAALAAFRADPALHVVRASSTEVYGANAAVPADADIYFQGVDQRVGPLTKYARIEAYANS